MWLLTARTDMQVFARTETALVPINSWHICVRDDLELDEIWESRLAGGEGSGTNEQSDTM